MARAADPDIAEWNEASRLNPAAGAASHLDDPRVAAAFASIRSTIGRAMANLARVEGTATARAAAPA